MEAAHHHVDDEIRASPPRARVAYLATASIVELDRVAVLVESGGELDGSGPFPGDALARGMARRRHLVAVGTRAFLLAEVGLKWSDDVDRADLRVTVSGDLGMRLVQACSRKEHRELNLAEVTRAGQRECAELAPRVVHE
jgi:hypothetical protein